AILQTPGFKAPFPPTTVESPFYLAQAKTGIGVERKLEGRQLLPGGLWKPIGFFRNLSPGDNYQKNPTPKRVGNKPIVALDAAKRIERVWGKVPDHRDWDLRTAVRDALASIRTKRNDYVLPFIDTFRRERRATTIESMAPGPEKMRMIGPLEKIAELEEGYRSTPAGWLAGTGMEMPIIDGRENKLFQLHIHERISFVCLRSKMTPP
ncbi:MAG: hypothetical protein GY820_32375, partial [Gammaproteobacteria bacterium]|nr:hypothetical protein [Gammaproteobacteria bacterium]